MKKGTFLFWALFTGILVFALGVQFAYSQGVAFATTPSTPAYHSSNEIICDDCISSTNIGAGAVGSAEIADGTITDGDVSGGAGIFSRKINGANGWHFTTGVMANQNTWYSAPATDLISGGGAGVMGMTSWNNAFIELTCDPAIVSPPGNTVIGNNILIYAGYDFLNLFRTNSLIMYVTPTTTPTAYYARNTAGTFSQSLIVRPSSTGSSLEFSRSYVGTSPNYPAGYGSLTGTPIETQTTGFECVVKVLSLCSGGTYAGASCGP